jgi:hypothetical protein
MSALVEVVPGILHWSGRHPRIGQDVHSYLIPEAGAVLDPILPDGVLEALRESGPPDRVLLTNRHHYRDSARLVAELGCTVHCPESGLHEFEGGPEVAGYAWGDEPAPGITAHEDDAICPDDGALHIAVGAGALALADAVIRWDGELSFVPDFLMDDPEGTKRGIVEALRRLCELDFDALLLAHGEPIPGGGREALAAFVESPRQASFSL